jgi:outer membrane protein OmpA-like peptidoglycan-associated protein
LKTDDLGFFSYGLDCLKEDYAVEGKKEGYFDDYAEFKIVSNVTQTSNVKLQLAPIPAPIGTDLTELLSLNPIYFDFDESYVRDDAKAELEKVIAYLERYQTVKLDVRSHTDSRGTDEYNIDLSNKRNIATQDYILKHGSVIQDRLSGKGYGESQLTNKCSDGVPCSKKLHQANRRSEFIILDN